MTAGDRSGSARLSAALQPLSQWPIAERRAVRGVFTDIDDTLTHQGAITPQALDALRQLRAAGLAVIAITGRPVGWSLPFAASWPVDAIVAENGSVALLGRPDAPPRRVYMETDAGRRRENFRRLQSVAARLLREVPQARLALDSPGRETDIAIDHSEFHHLGAAQIAQVVRIMRSEGMHATVSSIHINGWYGEHDKLAGARWILRECFGRELAAEIGAWAYVGDSTNDQLMFQAFPNSVGVANIRRFLPELTHRPRYLSASERGTGFAEVARALLLARPARAG